MICCLILILLEVKEVLKGDIKKTLRENTTLDDVGKDDVDEQYAMTHNDDEEEVQVIVGQSVCNRLIILYQIRIVMNYLE